MEGGGLTAPAKADDVWSAIRAELRAAVTDVTFHLWLEPLECAAIEGAALRLRAPGHVRRLVEERYLPLIRSVARRAAPELATVELVDPSWARPEPGGGRDGDGLNPRYTFDQFVIGEGNRFAHAAALAVAELPGQAYNPLFIHGPPGLGKTHLLHAIGRLVRAHDDGLTVRCTTLERFTAEFVEAVARGGSAAAFRERFRSVDVLLIDDVQFLADKVRTAEELFHTFNALHDSGRQVVITSDRSPADMGNFEDRLSERFASGLVVELEPPDFDVRLAILQKRVAHDVLDVADETLAELARGVTSSIRALEGALVRLVAYASFRGERPSPPLVRDVLERFYGRGRARPSVEEIQAAVARAADLEPETLVRNDRRPHPTLARQVAMHLARELTAESLPAIGARFGGRAHTTVLHAHRSIERRAAEDDATASLVRRARDEVERRVADRAR